MTIFSTHPLQGPIKPVPDVRVRHFTEAGVLTTFQCLEAREERLKIYIERIDARTSGPTGNSNKNMLYVSGPPLSDYEKNKTSKLTSESTYQFINLSKYQL